MLILGADPGLANFGIGLIEVTVDGLVYRDHRCLNTDKESETCDRLRELYDGFAGALDEFTPDIVAIETLYFARNAKTAIGVAQARGAALAALGGRGMEVMEITPSQIKMSLVGYGRAEKKQIQLMVKQVLKLPDIPKPDHAADALAAAITCAHMRKAVKRGM